MGVRAPPCQVTVSRLHPAAGRNYCVTALREWPMFDLVIRNALIVDGCGGKPYNADLAIQDDRIDAIGAEQENAGAYVDANKLTGAWVNGVRVHDGQEYLDHARPPRQVLTEFAA